MVSTIWERSADRGNTCTAITLTTLISNVFDDAIGFGSDCSMQDPGAVERSFGPSRTVQAVDDDTARAYGRYVFGQLSGDPTEVATDRPDIFALLSPLDREDLAGLYLQAEGYLLVPSTIKSSAAAYEWVMFHRDSGERAVLQVKSGGAWIDLAPLADIPSRVFVVAADGTVAGHSPANVTLISRERLLQFAKNSRSLMPERIRMYLDWASD